jgi:uncharacterized protein with ParB-like and HNH nuclease domain
MERGLSTFNSLIIGNRIFRIPLYQRHYSWDKKQWDDLWNDLMYLKSGKKHYFGTILQKATGSRKTSGITDFDVYEIIDGQQRITTALIFLKAIISQLNAITEGDLEEDLKKLREDYLKYKDVYKLELLGDDQEFFRRNVINDEEYPDEILTPSQRRLLEAKLYFMGKLEELKKTLNLDEFNNLLFEFKRRIGDMEIIRYQVENDADAVLIFETVNDRGKPLTNLEKTKSFLMHTIYLSAPEELEGHLDQVNASFADVYRWIEDIRNTIRGRNLGEDDIQRYHFVIYESKAKGSRDISYEYLSYLKDRIRGLYRQDSIQCLDYVLNYTKDLRRAFYALKEIISLEKGNGIEELISKLFVLERVANFYPLLIATWIRFREEKEKMEGILTLIETMAFRTYAIGRRRADTGESWLYNLAYKVHSENLGYDDIVNELRSVIRYYENDRAFERDLGVENFYRRVSSKDKKYLLFEYEKFLREQSGEPLDINLGDILTPDFEIEHIWASDPSKLNLSADLVEIHEQYKDKLGNLTIASQSWNSRWGNESFEVKKKEYQNSLLRVQKTLSDIEQWGKEQIEKRESGIVEFASSRWKI